jgi:hypothetical protein
VENTENDYFTIFIYVIPSTIKRIAIINGFAQNQTLYLNNNRIKAIGTTNKTILDDNKLSYQIINRGYQGWSVTDIYRGNKYNDTCLAEYNIYTTEYGWLFGDINE